MPRRPAPLSDDLFKPAAPAVAPGPVVVKNAAAAATMLGATNDGMPLPVKNTFIDVPSGLTPSNMKLASGRKTQPVMTAPPDLCKPPGFLQRAVVASVAQVVAGPVQGAPSPTGTFSGSAALHSGYIPLATPSPTAAATAFRKWCADPSLGMVHSTAVVSRVVTAAPVPGAPPQTVAPAGALVRVAGTVAEEDENDEDDSDDGAPQPQPLRDPADAPKPPPGALHPSLGSENHAEGTCKRCCFFPRGRCANGYTCEFCHYEHEKRKRKSKKKKKKEATAEGAATASETSPASAVSPVPSAASPVTTVTSPVPSMVGPIATVVSPVPTAAGPVTTVMSPVPTSMGTVTRVTSPVPTAAGPMTTLTSPTMHTAAGTITTVAGPVATMAGPVCAVAGPYTAMAAPAPALAPALPPGATAVGPPAVLPVGALPVAPGGVVPLGLLQGPPGGATAMLQPTLGHIIYGPTQVRGPPEPLAAYQGFAPPPQLPPRLQQVVELTPPPPMQSPKMRQAQASSVQGGMLIGSR